MTSLINNTGGCGGGSSQEIDNNSDDGSVSSHMSAEIASSHPSEQNDQVIQFLLKVTGLFS